MLNFPNKNVSLIVIFFSFFLSFSLYIYLTISPCRVGLDGRGFLIQNSDDIIFFRLLNDSVAFYSNTPPPTQFPMK